MNQPIPRNGTGPLKVGDRVQIVPEGKTRATINTNASSSKPHPTPPKSASKHKSPACSSNPPNGSKPIASIFTLKTEH
jgi:hypothetical protein